MRSNNNHEAITHLAMPERQIPVLIDSSTEKASGYVSSKCWSDRPLTSVRCLPSSFVEDFTNPLKRKQIEMEHGAIDDAALKGFLELVALLERVNAGDTSLVSKRARTTKKSWSEGETTHLVVTLSRKVQSIPVAVSEAFTNGLSNARIVVWWSEIAKKFAPGLYCPDIMTAVHALVLSAVGTPGGVGVCQKCETPFIRSRAKQLYCNHKCQVAAGMQRYRTNLERNTKLKSKIPAKRKKRTERT